MRIVAIAILAAGCSGSVAIAPHAPATDGSVVAAADPEVADILRRAGEVEHELRERGLVLDDDPELQAYLDSVGRRVISAARLPAAAYRFAVLRDPFLNAFALPSGSIYVHMGLMARIEIVLRTIDICLQRQLYSKGLREAEVQIGRRGDEPWLLYYGAEAHRLIASDPGGAAREDALRHRRVRADAALLESFRSRRTDEQAAAEKGFRKALALDPTFAPVRIEGYSKSGGEVAKDVAKSVAGAVLTLGYLVPIPSPTSGATIVSALVDGSTGDVLWTSIASHASFDTPGLQALVNAVFKNFPPGSFGTNATTAAKAGEN